jgi:tetratricopeptide (TPR) repeat protein
MKQERWAEALAVWEMAYRNGFFESAASYLQLASLYAHAAVPHEAAAVLITGIKRSVLPQNETNLKTLYEYLFQAKEHEAALKYLQKAADLSPKGVLKLHVARLLFELERYAEAAAAIEAAFEKGEIVHPEEARLLLGVAYYEAGEREKAQRVFERLAREVPEKAKTAREWLAFLKSLE